MKTKKKEYSDIELRKAQQEVVRLQVERFRLNYADYFGREETQKLVKFFFEKIYDLDAQETIIQTAIETYNKVKGQLSSETRENLENLIELNQLTHDLDKGMANLLLEGGWKEDQQLNQQEYFDLYVAFGHEDERRKQLLSSLKSMMESYRMAHKAFSEMVLKAGKGFAVMFGVLSLYRFAEDGYYATKAVRPDTFNKFIDDVTDNELAFIVKAFGE